MNRVVILANGEFPTCEEPLKCLSMAQKIICCDGAAEKLIKFGRKPDYIVGDMDSLPVSLQQELQGIIYKSSCQETNDLTKAFNLAQTLNPTSICILGATGLREDHTLGNISLIMDYAVQATCPVEMVTDFGRFISIGDTSTLHCSAGQHISIFAFDHTLKIKSAGLKYPTDSVVFSSLWKGTLNEALSESFTLELSHPCSVLLFFANYQSNGNCHAYPPA